ncbi:MAG: hypothetical protein MZW92_25940 [Comamonadaceae bacterium]|nr:hypothetical protein [Comamonadaceae bacterium]
MRWRTGRHREALWKSLVLPAGGVALCWLLLMTLWLPLLDYARSPRAVGRAHRARMCRAGACIAAPGCAPAAVAALEYFGALARRRARRRRRRRPAQCLLRHAAARPHAAGAPAPAGSRWPTRAAARPTATRARRWSTARCGRRRGCSAAAGSARPDARRTRAPAARGGSVEPLPGSLLDRRSRRRGAAPRA